MFDSANGTVSQPVVVLETELDRVRVAPGQPARLALIAREPLPDGVSEASCVALGEVAEALAEAARNNPDFIRANVTARGSDDCLYWLQFRNPAEGTHFWRVFLPLGDGTLAVWQITVPRLSADDYAEAVQRILNTLRPLNSTSLPGTPPA
ncbi:MAG: hypothetical protein HC915_05955 [Anaerolineae bacterium]|nr:hypothetical protein [Anaerolineae bacterium]